MLAEAGQTPTNYWPVSNPAAEKFVAVFVQLMVKHVCWLPHTQHDGAFRAILQEYFQSNCKVTESVLHPGFNNISFTLRSNIQSKYESDDFLLLTRMSVNRMSSELHQIKQNSTIKVSGGSNVRQQASGFYGTRPRTNPHLAFPQGGNQSL